VATDASETKIRYRRPPIIERALVVHTEMSEEKFRLRADEWQAIVKNEFPHVQLVTEWILAVTEKDGMPVLDPTRQTMTVRHTFWQMAGKKKDHGIQIWPDKIAFNVLGEVGNPRDFNELEQLREKWLMRWASHFDISTAGGVTLEYVNLLSNETLPTFMENARLKIGDAVQLFQVLPSSLHQLHPPFDFQINVEGETEPPSRFRAHCISVEGAPNTPTMQLRFTAYTYKSERSVPIEKVATEARIMHDLILRQFDAYFTPAAKQTFEPICP
jgi:hypothetical protein